MTRRDPRTLLERALTTMKSPAAALEVCFDDRGRQVDGSLPPGDGPNWTVRPYLRAREIRVAWAEGLLGSESPLGSGGLWYLDTEHSRLLLTYAVAEGQRLFGLTTHWLEERDA